MDARQCMIVDLEKHGDKRMFITEQVSSINMNTKEQWTVRFKSSPRPFNYNPHRLLYITDPVSICLDDKGLYVRNKHITGVAELFRFANSRYTFYHVIHTDGYHENLCANDVYITRTPIAISGGSNWEYLKKLAAETGLTTDKDENDVLQVIRTVPGNHARGHINQREIETIVQEVMPEYANSGSIGIITPYRTQAAALNKALDKDISSTVHKYQGRECDAIIMSMVDNTPTAFS